MGSSQVKSIMNLSCLVLAFDNSRSILDRFPVLSRRDAPVGTFPKMPESVHPGVVSGQALIDLLPLGVEAGFCKEN